MEESQDGRGWQGPLWVTQSNPLPKQGHPEQAAQDKGGHGWYRTTDGASSAEG